MDMMSPLGGGGGGAGGGGGGLEGSGGGAIELSSTGAMGSPLLSPEPPGTSRGELVAPPSRGKWGSSVKTSFLAGLHPSRWGGRSSASGFDRPSPPMVR